MIDVGYELEARSREEGTSYKLAPAEGIDVGYELQAHTS